MTSVSRVTCRMKLAFLGTRGNTDLTVSDPREVIPVPTVIDRNVEHLIGKSGTDPRTISLGSRSPGHYSDQS